MQKGQSVCSSFGWGFLMFDVIQETAAANGVTAMPTFMFFRNKTKIDTLRGADAGSLEEKILKWYGSGNDNEDEAVVKGQVSDRERTN